MKVKDLSRSGLVPSLNVKGTVKSILMRTKDEIIASVSTYLVEREEAAKEMRGSTIKI